jgi:hypothetical protein
MYDLFIMDMGGHDANVHGLQTRFPHARVVRYYDNHLDTLKRCIARCRTPYAWVISSCCDYTAFDFDYHSVPWESYQIHCWASGKEKFGDTFLIPVVEFKKQWDIALLEWYKDINWHEQGVPRLDWPILTTRSENITEQLKDYRFDAPYVWINQSLEFDPPLWSKRAFYTFNSSGNISIAPREIQTYLSKQIYDYPHIIKQKSLFSGEKMLDIIYVSNGESVAEANYKHLIDIAGDRVKRVDGVKGRVAAYQAAAKLSSTAWFFLVPAKLGVAEDFDWSWQPDYLQEPKHYIFHARNPLNDLCYGHMAMIAYNRQLVLDTDSSALDFALSQAHTVIPIISGVAQFNDDALMTWRTAFREVIKLKDHVVKTSDVESIYRLDIWLNRANGFNGCWSLKGARDALAYYQSVDGDYTELMRSYDWDWLKEYFDSIYHDQLTS